MNVNAVGNNAGDSGATGLAAPPGAGNAQGTATGSNAGAAAASLGGKSMADDFLKLLVAQLQAQDPLQPQSGAEFVSQLAQINAVEQAAQTNTKLDSLLTAEGSVARNGLTSLVGRNVTARTDGVNVPTTGPASDLTFRLDGAATKVQLQITDGNGSVVRTVPVTGAKPAGECTVSWDGKDDKGKPLPAGTYHLTVTATDAANKAVGSAPFIRGPISSLQFDASGTPRLLIGTTAISPGDVLTVN